MVYGRKKRSSRLSLRSWLVHKHLARITSKPPLDLFPLLFRHIIHLRGDIHLLGLPEYRVVIVNEAAAVYQIQVTKRVCDMNMQHHNLAILLQKLLKKCIHCLAGQWTSLLRTHLSLQVCWMGKKEVNVGKVFPLMQDHRYNISSVLVGKY